MESWGITLTSSYAYCYKENRISEYSFSELPTQPLHKDPLFVLSHSNRYFGLFIGINRSRDAPGRKQFFPCQLFSLANLASTVLVCMIWQNNTMEDCSSLTWSMSWNTPNWSQANYRQTQFRRQLCPNINYSTMETYTPVIDPPDVFVTSYAPPSLICNSCHIIKE